jgi:hypothetical protein
MKPKSELSERLAANRAKLEATLARLTSEQRTAPGAVGEWSAKDVLAHLAEWEEMHIHWMELSACGQAPEVPAPEYTWKADDVDRLNQAIYEKHCARTWEDVYGWAQAVHARFMAQYERLSEDDLHRKGVVPFTNNLYNWYNHFAMHDSWGAKNIYNKWIKKPRKSQ